MKRRAILLALLTMVAPPVVAQTAGELHLRRLLSVPLGALPPAAMLMPASRNNNYWVVRLQGGTQWDNLVGDLGAAAAGLDFQWQGGSSFGLTAGYQWADCGATVTDCGPHALVGGRARFNLVTGGPTIAALLGDNGATTTLGAEFGMGYAPNAIGNQNACAWDVGAPVSVSLFQKVRLLTFLTPGIAWDARCIFSGSAPSGASTFLGAGFGLQQIGSRGLDISFGAQRIFRRGAGLQLGINITYVRLP